MREQQANLSIPRRASASVDHRQYTVRTASPHRAGHFAGLHPEDAPYYTAETRTRRPPRQTDEEEDIYDERSRSSAVRYRPLYEEREERGLSPYQSPSRPQEKQRKLWVFYCGVALLVMLTGWVLISLLGLWWQAKVEDWTYGNPRTYQTDADAGHGGRVSHFIVLNNHGEIEVIETQKGHPDAAKIYIVVVLPADQAGVPATISFQDMNGDGKIDGLVHIGATEIPLYNNGTEFQSQPPQAK